jgi:hypothetical protein
MKDIKRKSPVWTAGDYIPAFTCHAQHLIGESLAVSLAMRRHPICIPNDANMRKDAPAEDCIKRPVREREKHAVGRDQAFGIPPLCPFHCPVAIVYSKTGKAGFMKEIDFYSNAAPDGKQLVFPLQIVRKEPLEKRYPKETGAVGVAFGFIATAGVVGQILKPFADDEVEETILPGPAAQHFARSIVTDDLSVLFI